MNKSELIEELAAKTGYNPKLTDKMVRIFFDRIKAALIAGDKVEIRGFGSFTLKKYKGYFGRNPKTGELWRSNLSNFQCSGQAKICAVESISKSLDIS